MRLALLDASGLVALLDPTEEKHGQCADFVAGFPGEFVTSEAAVTEATHLLGRVRGARSACLRFILGGGAAMAPLSAGGLHRCLELVEKYEDVPMDFADATLVTLGEQLRTNEILTLDRRGFGTYRLHDREPFVIRS